MTSPLDSLADVGDRHPRPKATIASLRNEHANIHRVHLNWRRAKNQTKGVDRLVLLVEDDPDIQSLVAEHLNQVGFQVCVASDGETAIRLARERRPGVVCLDLKLPRISGYDVCEQIRADPALTDTAILITSARNTFDIRVFSIEAGADACLTKPFSMKELVEQVDLLFEQRARDRKTRSPAPGTEGDVVRK